MPMYRDPQGNPIIVTMDQMLQRGFNPYADAFRHLESGGVPEVHNVQAAAAGEADIDFTELKSSVIFSATVDAYVHFDQAATSATTGFYVPAKTQVRLPIGCRVLNVYLSAAGTATAIGMK